MAQTTDKLWHDLYTVLKPQEMAPEIIIEEKRNLPWPLHGNYQETPIL